LRGLAGIGDHKHVRSRQDADRTPPWQSLKSRGGAAVEHFGSNDTRLDRADFSLNLHPDL